MRGNLLGGEGRGEERGAIPIQGTELAMAGHVLAVQYHEFGSGGREEKMSDSGRLRRLRLPDWGVQTLALTCRGCQ